MKHCLWLLLGLLIGCQGKSSDGSDPGPSPTPEPVACTQLLQKLKLNETLRLTDLDSTALFIKNNALELQKMDADEAAKVWGCLEQGS